MVMKKISGIILFMTMTFPAFAGTAKCSAISNHDARMTCMAVATGNSSYCGFVKDSDSRMKCYISVGK
jgi:hypothetical protein